MTMMNLILMSGALIFIYVLIGWLISLALKNSSIMDIMWGFGFLIVAWFYFIYSAEGLISRKLLMSFLVTIWGLRLSAHIYLRNKGKGEDFRYKNWRMQYSNKWWWFSFFKVFLLQGFLMWIISAPLLGSQFGGRNNPIGFIDFLGALLWIVGFSMEALSDYQLSVFKSKPVNKGKVLDSGLWKYSRHPNYFGEALQWWGFFLISAAAGNVWTIFSPSLMTFLLLKVSGVSLLEKSIVKNKPGYKEYIEKTNAFIPWFPKAK